MENQAKYLYDSRQETNHHASRHTSKRIRLKADGPGNPEELVVGAKNPRVRRADACVEQLVQLEHGLAT